MEQTFGVVIPTQGRRKNLPNILESLAGLRVPPYAVAVNDQSESDEIARVCEERQGLFPILRRTTRTFPRGVSSARNGAIAAILGDVDWICTLDDDSVIVDSPIGRIEEFGNASAIAGRYRSSRIASYAPMRFTIDLRTAWTHTVESAMFFRSDALRAVGLFDETLGTGNATPWQSGEGTDLIFRCMTYGPVLYDPDFVVTAAAYRNTDFPISKHRRYARGTGRVMRKWCPKSQQFQGLLGPVGRAARCAARGEWHNANLRFNIMLGRLEGLLGRTWGQE